MQHDQGFTRKPSGNYSLHIAQAAARVIINTTMMQHVPTLLTVSMAIVMGQYYRTHCLMEEVRGFHKSH